MAGENIVHFAGLRLRVTGTGNLIPTYFGLDNIRSKQLVAIPMSTTDSREPFRLGSFVSQRAMIQVKTTSINERFRINRIILYVKPLYTSFPG